MTAAALPMYPWPGGKRMALCVSFDFDGPSPHLWAKRDDASRLVGELEQRRFGPRIGIWRVLDLLAEVGVSASFFVPGAMADAYPSTVEVMLAGGHEVALHGYLHERVESLSSTELRDVLERSVRSLERAGTGRRLGYRSPSWEMTEAAWFALRDAEVAYDSSLMGSDVPYDVEGLVEVPVDWALDDAVYYRYTPGTLRSPVLVDDLVAAWTADVEAARRFGTCVVLTMHPWISGRGARAVALERLLLRYVDDTDVWWATALEIADHHRSLADPRPGYELRPGLI